MEESTQDTITELDGGSTAGANGNPRDADQRSPRPHPATRRHIGANELRSNGDGMSRLLRVEEVASLLNVPRKWVYRRVGLRAPHGLPHVKIGKYLRFRESDVRDYVDSLRRA